MAYKRVRGQTSRKGLPVYIKLCRVPTGCFLMLIYGYYFDQITHDIPGQVQCLHWCLWTETETNSIKRRKDRTSLINKGFGNYTGYWRCTRLVPRIQPQLHLPYPQARELKRSRVNPPAWQLLNYEAFEFCCFYSLELSQVSSVSAVLNTRLAFIIKKLTCKYTQAVKMHGNLKLCALTGDFIY